MTLLVAGAGTGAVAQDDEESFDQKIISNVLSTFGLKSNQGDIDYKERSPLVIPPRVELPPPQTDPAATVRNWPVDPDVKRRKADSSRRTGRDYEQESMPIRPSELNVGTPQRSRSPASPHGEAGAPENPRQLGYRGGILGSIWGSDDKPVAFTQEPPRNSLTEPPPGYQTPSPDQPYVAKSKSVLPGIPTFWDFGTDRK
jgi:hypothetical protein